MLNLLQYLIILLTNFQVKQGAENMLKSLANSGHSRDKKLMGEAQQMLQDSKAKIEYLKMRILKVRQGRGSLRAGGGHDPHHNGDISDKGVFYVHLYIYCYCKGRLIGTGS